MPPCPSVPVIVYGPIIFIFFDWGFCFTSYLAETIARFTDQLGLNAAGGRVIGYYFAYGLGVRRRAGKWQTSRSRRDERLRLDRSQCLRGLQFTITVIGDSASSITLLTRNRLPSFET